MSTEHMLEALDGKWSRRHVPARTTATSPLQSNTSPTQSMSALSRLAVPFVYLLIFFLGYPSQWLLMRLEPGPMTKNELLAANITLVLIWITYTRAVFVDPGTIPRDWAGKEEGEKEGIGGQPKEKEGDFGMKSRKWCRKCEAAKPPRAHHCKECGRCVPFLHFTSSHPIPR